MAMVPGGGGGMGIGGGGFGGGGGGGGGGGPGGPGSYNIFVNIDLSRAQFSFNQFNTMVNQFTSTVDNSVNNLNNRVSNSFKFVDQNITRNTTNIRNNIGQIAGSAAGAERSIRSMVGGMEGILLGVNLTRNLGQALQDAIEKSGQLGDKYADFMNSLRDIQALSGRPGAVTPQIGEEMLRISEATGATNRQVHDSVEALKGEAQILVEQGVVSDRTLQDITQRSIRYGMTQGGELTPYAKLAGRFALLAGKEAEPERVQQQLGETFRILGFAPGRTSELLPQFQNVLSRNVLPGGQGNIQDWRRAAILTMGANFFGSTGQVSTLVDQTVRGVMGATRERSEAFMQWQKQHGITPGMDAYQRLERIIPSLRKMTGMAPAALKAASEDIKQAGDEEDVKPETQRIMAILRDQLGIKNAYTIRGLIGYMANWERVAGLEGMPQIQPREIERGLRRAEAQEPRRLLVARARTEAEEIRLGSVYMERNRRFEEARSALIKSGQLTPETMPAQGLTDWLRARGLTGAPTTPQRLVGLEALRKLQVEYGRAFFLGTGPDQPLTLQDLDRALMNTRAIPDAIKEAQWRQRQNRGRRPRGMPQVLPDVPTEGTAAGTVKEWQGYLHSIAEGIDSIPLLGLPTRAFGGMLDKLSEETKKARDTITGKIDPRTGRAPVPVIPYGQPGWPAKPGAPPAIGPGAMLGPGDLPPKIGAEPFPAPDAKRAIAMLPPKAGAEPFPAPGAGRAMAKLPPVFGDEPFPVPDAKRAMARLSPKIDAEPFPAPDAKRAMARLSPKAGDEPLPVPDANRAMAKLSPKIGAETFPTPAWRRAPAMLPPKIGAEPFPSPDARRAMARLSPKVGAESLPAPDAGRAMAMLSPRTALAQAAVGGLGPAPVPRPEGEAAGPRSAEERTMKRAALRLLEQIADNTRRANESTDMNLPLPSKPESL